MSADPTPTQGEELQQRAESLSREPTRPPTDVPGYDAERFLGRGAFGEVWVAVHRNTGCRVAIKFFTHRGGLDWSLLVREVEKLRSLSNDRYVVQLLEVGWDSEPPYYVMEFVAHGSLEELLQGGPLPVEEALALFREAAIGLSHAHHKGILHCDLKPANILLDQDHRPRLADFGQARLTEENSPALGTWFYMAPEQADFKGVPDVRWDVYSLGAVLYCMLTGQPPYRSTQASVEIKAKGNLEERLRRYQKLIAEARPPEVHRQQPEVDRALSGIVDRCLAADPRKRFPNVQAVLDALDERSLRRARQPVLLLGILGPALAMLVVCALCWFPLRDTIGIAAQDIRENQLKTQHAAARFNAENIARGIEHRFAVLQKEAADPRFRRLLAEAAPVADFNSPKRQELQRYLVDMHVRNANDFKTLFWYIDDAKGTELAISPLEKGKDTVGKNYRWRDYFHGLGFDVRPDDPRVTSLGPIAAPHQSAVFQSTARDAGRPYGVAFSVPVWGSERPAAGDQPLGILATSVEVGEFAQSRFSANEWVVLADMRSEVKGRRGVILQHPELEVMLGRNVSPSQMVVHLNADMAAKIDDIRATKIKDPKGDEISRIENYQDPLGAQAANHSGAWLAVVEPVVTHVGNQAQDTGWVVIVEGNTEQAIGWVEQVIDKLKTGLLWRSLIGLVGVLVVVTALSSFVVRALDRVSRRRLTGGLRGGGATAGTSSLSSQTALSARSDL